jgi:amino acid permease
MAGILCLTCKLLVMHLQPHEMDIGESIKRKMGPAFGITFTVICALEIFLVSSVYFLLASDLFYGALKEIFGTHFSI